MGKKGVLNILSLVGVILLLVLYIKNPIITGKVAGENGSALQITECGKITQNVIFATNITLFTTGSGISCLTVEGENIIIDGNGHKLIGLWDKENPNYDYVNQKGIVVINSNNITIKNIEFVGFGDGIRVSFVSNSVISDNKFVDMLQGVWWIHGHDNIIENNVFENTHVQGHAITILKSNLAGKGLASNFIVKDNIITDDNPSSFVKGIMHSGPDNGVIESNKLVFKTGNSGNYKPEAIYVSGNGIKVESNDVDISTKHTSSSPLNFGCGICVGGGSGINTIKSNNIQIFGTDMVGFRIIGTGVETSTTESGTTYISDNIIETKEGAAGLYLKNAAYTRFSNDKINSDNYFLSVLGQEYSTKYEVHYPSKDNTFTNIVVNGVELSIIDPRDVSFYTNSNAPENLVTPALSEGLKVESHNQSSKAQFTLPYSLQQDTNEKNIKLYKNLQTEGSWGNWEEAEFIIDTSAKTITLDEIYLEGKTVYFKVFEDKEVVEEIEEICVDSDGGKDYYTKGIVTIPTTSYEDTCNYDEFGLPLNENYSVTTVVEKYCENNTVKTNYYNCPNSCENGACVDEIIILDHCEQGYLCIPKIENQTSSCVETDGGMNFEEAGRLNYIGGTGWIYINGVYTNGKDRVDYCLTTWVLQEFYCTSSFSTIDYECDGICRNGACIEDDLEIACPVVPCTFESRAAYRRSDYYVIKDMERPPELVSAKYPYQFNLKNADEIQLTLHELSFGVNQAGATNTFYIKVDGSEIYSMAKASEGVKIKGTMYNPVAGKYTNYSGIAFEPGYESIKDEELAINLGFFEKGEHFIEIYDTLQSNWTHFLSFSGFSLDVIEQPECIVGEDCECVIDEDCEDNQICESKICEELEEEIEEGELAIYHGCNPEKILICHKEKNEICVAESAVDAHLAHLDYLGECVEEETTFVEVDIAYGVQKEIKTGNNEVETIKIKSTKSVDSVDFAIRSRNEPPQGVKKHTRKVSKYIIIDHPEINSEDIEETKIEFNVRDDWLKENNMNMDYVILSKFINNNWHDLDTSFLRTEDNIHYYEATTEGLSVFAITASDSVESVESSDEPLIEIESNETLSTNKSNNESVESIVTTKNNYLLTTLIFVLILSTTMFLVFKKLKNKKEIKQTINPFFEKYATVLEYIQEMREKGKTEEEIIRDLEEVGWKFDLIKELLSRK